MIKCYMTSGAITEGIAYGYNGEAYNGTTDLQYLRYRHYSPNIGRFNVIDSYLGDVLNPLSRNRYVYAENNPIMGIDPSGRATDWNSLSTQGIKDGINYYKNNGNNSELSTGQMYLEAREMSDYYLKNEVRTLGAMYPDSERYSVYRKELLRRGLTTSSSYNDNKTVSSANHSGNDFVSPNSPQPPSKPTGGTSHKTDGQVNSADGHSENDACGRGYYYCAYHDEYLSRDNLTDITIKLNGVMLRGEYMYRNIVAGLDWAGRLMEFKNIVQSGSVFDLKLQPEWQEKHYIYDNELIDNDEPGNINYGYLGKVFGIPDMILYAGAGFAQLQDGTSKFEYWSSFFDDPRDQKAIKKGIEIYNKNH